MKFSVASILAVAFAVNGDCPAKDAEGACTDKQECRTTDAMNVMCGATMDETCATTPFVKDGDKAAFKKTCLAKIGCKHDDSKPEMPTCAKHVISALPCECKEKTSSAARNLAVAGLAMVAALAL